MEPTRLMLRLYFGPLMLGPGKADLLEAIAAEGSISAAGRRMGMSYKPAWTPLRPSRHTFSSRSFPSRPGAMCGLRWAA